MELLRSWLRKKRREGIEDRSRVEESLVGTLVEVENRLMSSDLTCAERMEVDEKEVDEDFEVL